MTDAGPTPFRWRLCLAAVPFGLAFAGLTIAGAIGPTTTMRLALTILVVIGVSVGFLEARRPFRHGLVAGFVCCLAAVETQALFLATYFVNNPEYAGVEMPFGLSPRVATALLGPFNALLGGVIAATVASLTAFIFRRRGPS